MSEEKGVVAAGHREHAFPESYGDDFTFYSKSYGEEFRGF